MARYTELVFLFGTICVSFVSADFDATWESLDSRELPQWYDDAKFGIFLHWGVYAVPGFGSEWFWANWKGGEDKYVDFIDKNYPRNFTYQQFATDFTAEFFDPEAWANLFKLAGAKYVVLTSKHHEGFTLWPSKHAFSWNSVDVGPHRDIVGSLSTAIRNSTDLRFGVYYSLLEWYNPLYLEDKENEFNTSVYYYTKVRPELIELIEKYKLDILWTDGEWEAYDTYWHATEFIAWLYNESPVKDTVVVNDRWGSGILCQHGDFHTCTDRYNPGVLQGHKWENAMTVDSQSWGHRRNADITDYLTTQELIESLVTTVSCGGNLLLNVGPTKDGMIEPAFQERLLNIGTWLGSNGEAIYGTQAWSVQNDTISDVWYTTKDDTVYAITLSWPANNTLVLGSVTELFTANAIAIVTLLENNGTLRWSLDGEGVSIVFPNRATLSGNWAWAVKITKE